MKPKLTYFDAPVSRGEECRLALHVAGVDFEDVRINRADWPAMKPTTPFGSLPTLEMPGQPVLGQSNAILVLIGRRYGLHPKDDFEAARHEAMMSHVEDLRATVAPTLRIQDEAEKKKVRTELVAGFLPTWGANAEKHIGDGPFLAGATLHVADLKLYMAVHWFAGGKVDYVPATIFANFKKLVRLHDAVRDHAGVKSWYAKG
jgi:prostaglandin-H2 D-isomerase / glutathione transferase